MKHYLNLLLVSFALAWSEHAVAEIYPITIAGQEVTDMNQHDVLGDGTVQYDPTTHTLTLRDAHIQVSGSSVGIQTKMEQLTLRLEGANRITSQEGGAMRFDNAMTHISGAGSLQIDAPAYGIYGVHDNGQQLTIEECRIQINSTNHPIWLLNDPSTLTLRSVYLSIKTTEAPILVESLNLDNCYILSPLEAEFENGRLVVEQGEYHGNVEIEAGVQYHFALGFTVATSNNKNDILGDGTAKYTPETNTLTLTDANVVGLPESMGASLSVMEKDLNVELIGTNRFTSPQTGSITNIALVSEKTPMRVRFFGPGKLLVTSPTSFGIVCHKSSVEIQDASVEITSALQPFMSQKSPNSTLTLRNTHLTLNTQGVPIQGFGQILLDGCYLHTPQGGTTTGGMIKIKGGTYQGKVEIQRGADPNGIELVEEKSLRVEAHDGKLYIAADDSILGEQIDILSPSGIIRQSVTLSTLSMEIPLPSGCYLIRLGQQVYKIII